MTDIPTPTWSAPVNAVNDWVSRYGSQVTQVFAALATLRNRDTETEAALRMVIRLDLNLLAITAKNVDCQSYFSNAGSAVKNLIDGAVSYKSASESRDQGDLDQAIADY